MGTFLYQFSSVHMFGILSVISIIVTIVAVFIVRSHIPLEVRYRDNGAIGNTSQLVSIIYGVLAGLMALYLMNNISYTSDAVQREANAVADIYRDSGWLKEPLKTGLRNEMKRYLINVIDVEWPLMQRGEVLSTNRENMGGHIINGIDRQLFTYTQTNNAELLIIHHILGEIKSLYDAREQRVLMSRSSLSPEIWLVILIGTVLAIGVNFLFGMNFYLHLITASSVALMVSSMIFLLVTLDRPFQGDFSVQPDAMRYVLYHIERLESQIMEEKMLQERMQQTPTSLQKAS